jgi:UDP-N-acetyl-D-mannosaminuronic acid dehydrogenase
MKFNNICVIGLGYIGLPTACFFAKSRVQVLGVDINHEILNTLGAGKVHIHEPGLDALVKEVIGNGSLTVANTPLISDAFIIAVPTPFYDGKKADLRAVKSAADAIVPFIKPGNLVVLESTSPPRTTMDIVAPILEKSGLKAGEDFYLAYSPERVLPGKIMQELVENDRVIGGINQESAKAGFDLYSLFVKGEILLSDSTTAEMVKLMENTYRDVNIAIANEFARLSERFGVNAWEAISLANRHPRVNILNPGPGVGGHCISVDPWFLVEKAPDLTKLILAAREVNDTQPEYVLHLINKSLNGSVSEKISVLGLSYKPDIDDLRESPAIEIANLLADQGFDLTAYEPYKSNGKSPKFKSAHSLQETIQDASIIVLLVGHNEFKSITPEFLLEHSNAKMILDTVGIWSEFDWESYDIHYVLLGDGSRYKNGNQS